MGRAMLRPSIREVDDARSATDRWRSAIPDPTTRSDQELVEFVRSYPPRFADRMRLLLTYSGFAAAGGSMMERFADRAGAPTGYGSHVDGGARDDRLGVAGVPVVGARPLRRRFSGADRTLRRRRRSRRHHTPCRRAGCRRFPRADGFVRRGAWSAWARRVGTGVADLGNRPGDRARRRSSGSVDRPPSVTRALRADGCQPIVTEPPARSAVGCRELSDLSSIVCITPPRSMRRVANGRRRCSSTTCTRSAALCSSWPTAHETVAGRLPGRTSSSSREDELDAFVADPRSFRSLIDERRDRPRLLCRRG